MRFLSFPTRPPSATLDSLWSSVISLVDELEGFLFATTLREQTIGTAETAVAHGKRWTPSIAIAVPRTNVAVWQSSQPDERYCYFTAASSVVVDIKVFR